jgi:hypothetical protein
MQVSCSNTGPGLSNLIAIAIMIINGSVKISKTPAMLASVARLI